MHGADGDTEQLFSIRRLEDFVPGDHPLRPIREMVNEALTRLDGVFARMYEPDVRGGRPSIAPEKLARAMLLQVFYSIRPERQLMEQGFDWAKLIGGIRPVMVRGLARVDQVFVLNMTAYNLVRMRTLGKICPQTGQMG